MIYLYYAIRLYELILLVRIFMSWIRPNPHNPIVKWIYGLTEPVLEPFRRMIPSNSMGFDFSPIIVFILLDILKRIVVPGVLF
jgi:YggT family protein